MVFAISDQQVQGVRALAEDHGPDLVTKPHSETDLGEGGVPVGRQFGLVTVQPSLPSWKVEIDLVASEFGVKVKSFLSINERNENAFKVSDSE